jgi:rare lipoprotein A
MEKGLAVIAPTARSHMAFHAKFPFGTRLRVTNMSNTKETIVRVDGRIAPYYQTSEVIELSEDAARNIGIRWNKPEQVKIEVVIHKTQRAARTRQGR